MMPNIRIANILLVEDNPGDAELIRETMEDSKLCNDLFLVKDGVEAMTFLHREEPYADAPRPDMILLDLNLPRKDGREVLAEIKKDDRFSTIPVIILTSSEAEEDILRAYHLQANCYVTKPVDLEQFIELVRSIDQFWFGIVTLPPASDVTD